MGCDWSTPDVLLADMSTVNQSHDSLSLLSTLQIPQADATITGHLGDRINRMSEAQIRDAWSQQREPLPEFTAAAATICLAPRWLSHTRLGRHLRSMDDVFNLEPKLKDRMANRAYYQKVVLAAIKKGYGLDDVDDGKASAQVDVVVGVKILKHMKQFAFDGPPGHLGGGKPQPIHYVTFALQVLTDLDEPAGIVAKLS